MKILVVDDGQLAISDPYLMQSGSRLRLYQCDDHRRCVELAASG